MQKFEICILTAGDTFGEEEITNMKNRQYTVLCDQDDSELYFIGHMVVLYKNINVSLILSSKIIKKNCKI